MSKSKISVSADTLKQALKAMNEAATVLMNCSNDTPEASAYVALEEALSALEEVHHD